MEKIGAVKNSLWKDDGSLVNTVCSSCLLYCTHKHMEPCDSDGQVGMAVFWINTMQHPLCMAPRAQGLKFPSLNLYWEFSNPKWVALKFQGPSKNNSLLKAKCFLKISEVRRKPGVANFWMNNDVREGGFFSFIRVISVYRIPGASSKDQRLYSPVSLFS